uniref:Reelin domain-containing protein n=1 Tax=Elaeophora elaphi TaxID=1147741 RepID=A0A0R3S578_9BILA
MFAIRLPVLCGMLQQIDFTESDPACNLMIPIYNQNIISPLKQTIFKIRIFDSNDRETFEYDAENKKILQGSAVINDGMVSRRHASLRWQPPNVPTGAIIFLASVIHSKQLYHIRSSFLSPVSNSTRYLCKLILVTKQGCGTSYGCFKIGNQKCLFGETCHFSLKWRCYKKSMIVEATHHGHVASFGLTESDKRAVLCISTNNNSSMNDYYITGDRGFPNIFDRPHSKRLKTINDGIRTFCRFEMERPRRNTSILLFGKVNSYGHPYKLRKWRIPGSNMCNPTSISSGVTRLPSTVYILSSSVHTLNRSANAYYYISHILLITLFYFNYL